MKGIDISCWNNNINYSVAKANGVEFAIIRCGYGKNEKDEEFSYHYKQCIKAGIKVPAVYHFLYGWSAEDANKNALNAIKICKDAGFTKGIIFADLEYDSLNYAAKMGHPLTHDMIRTMTKIFGNVVLQHGYDFGIYTNQDYAKCKYGFDFLRNYKNIWLADYEGECLIPCLYRQYSSNGHINGIHGSVDLDYYYGPVDTSSETKSLSEVAKEVWEGKWGNGDDRYNRLTNAGYDYSEVQAEVNRLASDKHKADIKTVAWSVIRGDYGNGSERWDKLRKSGYDPDEVQEMVNKIL